MLQNEARDMLQNEAQELKKDIDNTAEEEKKKDEK